MVSVCADIFLNKKTPADPEKIKQCVKTLLKRCPDAGSLLRKVAKLPVVSVMAAARNPDEKLNSIAEIFDKFNRVFPLSEYSLLTAIMLSDALPSEDTDPYIRRGGEIYTRMCENYPMLISPECLIYETMMAFSEKTDTELINDAFACFEILDKIFGDTKAVHNDSVRSLAHILAMSGDSPESKCQKLDYIYSSLKNSGKLYGKAYTLSVLGAVSSLPINKIILVKNITDVDDFLASQVSYGVWGADNFSRRLMLAALTVANSSTTGTALSTASIAAIAGTMAMIADQNDYEAKKKAKDSARKIEDEKRRNQNSTHFA